MILTQIHIDYLTTLRDTGCFNPADTDWKVCNALIQCSPGFDTIHLADLTMENTWDDADVFMQYEVDAFVEEFFEDLED